MDRTSEQEEEDDAEAVAGASAELPAAMPVAGSSDAMNGLTEPSTDVRIGLFA